MAFCKREFVRKINLLAQSTVHVQAVIIEVARGDATSRKFQWCVVQQYKTISATVKKFVHLFRKNYNQVSDQFLFSLYT